MNDKTKNDVIENQNALISILKERVNLYRYRSELLEDTQRKVIRELGYLKKRYDSADERHVVDKCIELIREIYE